jgi:biopolymer transport protein TolR
MAGGGGEQDLNLVPYMDIMVNLIMFMIVMTAYIVEMSVAPVLAPAYKSGGGGGASDQEKPKPFLTVAVSSKSIALLGSTDEVPASEFVASVDPKTGETVYPFAELTAQLRALQKGYAVSENLVITAEGAVPYSVLVRTMDAARSDAEGDLFPGVTLGLAVTGK